MAAQIAEGNATVIEYLQNVLTSENNANRLNQGHLQAIAASGYRPLLELEGSYCWLPNCKKDSGKLS